MSNSLILLPLDDRPPTYIFPQRIAAIAGIDLVAPPRPLLGSFLQPGDSQKLCTWLVEQAMHTDGMLVALDMLAYGGLVASRSTQISLQEALRSVEVLKTIKAVNPKIRLSVANVIMRISITVSDSKATQNYDSLIRYSELSWLVEKENKESYQKEYKKVKKSIPPEVLRGYLEARQRNHAINRWAIQMLAEGTLDELVLLQEDASTMGPHLLEQTQLWKMAHTLGVDDRLLIYPGADEGTQTLLASWINRETHPRLQVEFTSQEGAKAAVPYEDRPLWQTVENHIAAARCQPDGGSNAEVVLWVHSPCSHDEILQATQQIKDLVQSGKAVALADVRFPNGGDPDLLDALCECGVLPHLVAYAGWNTAGNTIGTTIAHLSAWLAASKAGASEIQRRAHMLFLWERLVDDWGYQRVVRQDVEKDLRDRGLDPLNLLDLKEEGDRRVAEALGKWTEQFYQRAGWPGKIPQTDIRLPWPRTFEVELEAR